MKLPNGFGSVYKLSGKRRKPWCARKTTGWTFNEEKQQSYPIYQFVGYYATRKEALNALTEYNNNPFDINTENITFEELYERWLEDKANTLAPGTITQYKKGYKLCSALYKLKIKDIKLDQIQKTIDESGKNTPTLKNVKSLMGLMYDYAVMHEMVPSAKRDMIKYIDINKAGNPNAMDRVPFTEEEIKILWDKAESDEYIMIILILIYTGARISEILNLKKDDVHLEERYFDIKEAKTPSGVRSVPIAEKIAPLFEHWLSKNSDQVICTRRNLPVKYRNYIRVYWDPVLEKLKMKHRPHDTRHTCVSLLVAKQIDERIIRRIVGHKGKDVTDDVYTHYDFDVLLEAINSI